MLKYTYVYIHVYIHVRASIMNRSKQGLVVFMSVMSSSYCVVNMLLGLVKVGDSATSILLKPSQYY